MTPEERSKMNYLCEKIATEKDQVKFDAFVYELKRLLDRVHPENSDRLKATPRD
jgi:hypothetical protein